MPQGKNKKLLTKQARKGNKGFPIATIAYYGSNNKTATKLVCGIIKYKGANVEPMEKWFSNVEIRSSEAILGKILSFIKTQEVKSVIVNEEIMGCPHEEGSDYLEGGSCPECSYWAGRDRVTHNRIH